VFAGQIAANVYCPLCAPPANATAAAGNQRPSHCKFESSFAGYSWARAIRAKDAMKTIADPTTRSQCGWRRRHGAFLGRSASERQRAIFAAKGRPYPPDRLIQPPDVAGLVRFLLLLPRTTEVTDIVMRPMLDVTSERNLCLGRSCETRFTAQFASRTRTQSPSPSRFLAGGVKRMFPEFGMGEPSTVMYSPMVGSYQRAAVVPASFAMSTVIVRMVGMYMIINVPSGVRAAVA